MKACKWRGRGPRHFPTELYIDSEHHVLACHDEIKLPRTAWGSAGPGYRNDRAIAASQVWKRRLKRHFGLGVSTFGWRSMTFESIKAAARC